MGALGLSFLSSEDQSLSLSDRVEHRHGLDHLFHPVGLRPAAAKQLFESLPPIAGLVAVSVPRTLFFEAETHSRLNPNAEVVTHQLSIDAVSIVSSNLKVRGYRLFPPLK